MVYFVQQCMACHVSVSPLPHVAVSCSRVFLFSSAFAIVGALSFLGVFPPSPPFLLSSNLTRLILIGRSVGRSNRRAVSSCAPPAYRIGLAVENWLDPARTLVTVVSNRCRCVCATVFYGIVPHFVVPLLPLLPLLLLLLLLGNIGSRDRIPLRKREQHKKKRKCDGL